jgi:hypothetical protein
MQDDRRRKTYGDRLESAKIGGNPNFESAQTPNLKHDNVVIPRGHVSWRQATSHRTLDACMDRTGMYRLHSAYALDV